jgi:cytochrome c5
MTRHADDASAPPGSRLTGVLAALATACVLSTACGASDVDPQATVRYLDDAAYRRVELEASLVNPNNGYSRLRLQHYASGNENDWDRLPEWNPAAEPIRATELDSPGGASVGALSASAAALALQEAVVSNSDSALIALGAEAFRRYPTQLAPYLRIALSSRDAAARYGLWVDDVLGVGGLVRARMADGSTAVALTCATCHAAPSGAAIAMGLPNGKLDLGAALLDGGSTDPATAKAIAAWGPGRLDVTTSTGAEPVAISDLRPMRWLTYLHHDATLMRRDRTMLAIRIETLIITSHDQVVRPPRVIALALAAYLESLADGLPSTQEAALASPNGAVVFASQCATCHSPPSLTGQPVALALVGTDPMSGLSADRGTGAYRVPSLHGVGTRGALLHDGTTPS